MDINKNIQKDAKYWLRWILVIPGALLSLLLVSFPLHWIMLNMLGDMIYPYSGTLEIILSRFVMAYTFIWAGSKIAPEYKEKVSLILFAFVLIISGVLIFMTITKKPYMGYELYFERGGLDMFLFILGAFCGALYTMYNSLKSTQPTK